jgi:hypothetical protein
MDIQIWRQQDWRCRRWAWGNILRSFAFERAKQLRIPLNATPRWQVCPICDHYFHQTTVRHNWLTLWQAAVCPVCFDQAIWAKPAKRSKAQIRSYLQQLAEVIQGIPHSDFGTKPEDYVGLSADQVVGLVRLLSSRPSLAQVKETHGSWFAALVAATVLPDGSQQMARGVRCIAEDNHVCFSLGEKTICDILYRHGVQHEREVVYPGNSAYRSDWKVGKTLSEYFGLTGNPEYDAKTSGSAKLYRANRNLP